MPIKRSAAVILTLIMMLGCLVGCGSQYSPGGNSLNDSSSWVSVTSEDGKYQLQVPAKWKDLKGQLSQDATLEYGDPSKEQYLMLLPESKESLSMNFKEYTTVILHNIASNMENAVIDQTADIAIQETPATLTGISGSSDQIKVQYWVYTVETQQDFLQVVTCTLQSKAEETKPLIEQVVGTLQPVSEESKQ
ncbi:hypothetical protein H8702_11255 [Massilimaliae timonensis]|uniref:Tfp pilus assembly protein, major pilin PilA n=1 Tax=Massiliimalia timonensis TaxID=1987501 RepID=A0A8J6U0L0_9FIRM|nr:hypothetical protein [Massiliimalia timonensis]MBC8611667.1 hypothetical protein [Massiliimalia timonensis]